MIIAEGLSHESVTIPAEVCRAAYGEDVYVTFRDSDITDERADWIACCQCWPHRDECYSEQFFLTLTLTDNRHTIGDSELKGEAPAQELRAGSLIVIDPGTVHWLSPPWSIFDQASQPSPWAAIQWQPSREDAPAVARAIVEHYGGRWVDDIDPRYSSWRRGLEAAA